MTPRQAKSQGIKLDNRLSTDEVDHRETKIIIISLLACLEVGPIRQRTGALPTKCGCRSESSWRHPRDLRRGLGPKGLLIFSAFLNRSDSLITSSRRAERSTWQIRLLAPLTQSTTLRLQFRTIARSTPVDKGRVQGRLL